MKTKKGKKRGTKRKSPKRKNGSKRKTVKKMQVLPSRGNKRKQERNLKRQFGQSIQVNIRDKNDQPFEFFPESEVCLTLEFKKASNVSTQGI